MTYFGFLGLFVILPSILLGIWYVIDKRRGKTLPHSLSGWPVWGAIGIHMLIALIYTTPWDNYLVATRVWWYDINLVTGITIGWVPIEEYTFFLLQPILTGLWLFTILRYLPVSDEKLVSGIWVRLIPLTVVGALWVLSALMLLDSAWRYDTYLGLELVWALPPIMLQLAFGADILWKHRRPVLLTIVTATLFLAFADSLAIQSGTWTIDPEQSLPVLLGGVLPIEEFVFFLLTNILLVFGVTLVVAQESHQRMPNIIRKRLPFIVNSRMMATD